MTTAARSQELFRKLPAVDEVLRFASVAILIERDGIAVVTDAARELLGRIREAISGDSLDERGLDLALKDLPSAIERHLDKVFTQSLCTVINATGVVLHTNLGRAPLSDAALDHMREVASGYSNLEFDLRGGDRGKRDSRVQGLFSKLLNKDAPYEVHTVVVNNCAAAVMLALNSLAEGGEVIVSRGELVEIGGSFRVPDVMSKSQATLREVGTTNRTRIEDYEKAITPKTRLILRVHRSNFAIVGFTEQPALAELVALGRKHSIPVMEDQGNGSLIDLRTLGVNNESGVAESLSAGVDIVTYSGDKLLGGPQAGMLSGREEVITRVATNPMFRALRVDKLTYAALETTLMQYLRGDLDAIPVVRMLRMRAEEIGKRAKAIASALNEYHELRINLTSGKSVIGGGTTPGAELPTFLLSIASAHLSATELQTKLRRNDPPIIARVEEGKVLIDLRTVFPEQDAVVLEALRGIATS